MLTKLAIRNFRRFDRVEIELGDPVAFLGPNDSGKSSALQALLLWAVGLRRWNQKWPVAKEVDQRPGVTLTRRDLAPLAVPRANLLWRNLHVRDVRRLAGHQRTSTVRIEVVVDGSTAGTAWRCGMEFDYANEESLHCRPLRTGAGKGAPRMPVPAEASKVRVNYLLPLQALAETETLLDPGAATVRAAEGRASEVLRNLCYHVHKHRPDRWAQLAERIDSLFGAALDPPRHCPERGEVALTYRAEGLLLDISAAGRGLQQTLLLLAFIAGNPGSVLLLDEPDAHLEPLRQRQMYRLVRETARDCGCQIIAATHSGVLLNEAADRDLAVAFVGVPHRIGRDRREDVLRTVRELGFEHYLQAEQTGWALYLNSPTDLAALQVLARRLGFDEAAEALQRPFVQYVANRFAAAERHFLGLVGVLPELRGVALLEGPGVQARGVGGSGSLRLLRWRRFGIWNYLCTRSALEELARREGEAEGPGPLFGAERGATHRAAMRRAIEHVLAEHARSGSGEPLSPGANVRDSFAAPVFALYREQLGPGGRPRLPDIAALADSLPADEIDPEVREKLEAIAAAAGSRPAAA